MVLVVSVSVKCDHCDQYLQIEANDIHVYRKKLKPWIKSKGFKCMTCGKVTKRKWSESLALPRMKWNE
jgi:hypothetical protein